MYVQCCVCNNRKYEDRWVAPGQEDYGKQETNEMDGEISHGYCPPCSEVALAKIRADASRAQTRRNLRDVVEESTGESE